MYPFINFIKKLNQCIIAVLKLNRQIRLTNRQQLY
jgi:hypothetical protein